MPQIPPARGPVSTWLVDLLGNQPGKPATDGRPPVTAADVLGDDAQIAMTIAHGLAYDGWDGVDDGWEHDPVLVAALNAWEAVFLDRLRAEIGHLGEGDVVAWLVELATPDPRGESTSAWLDAHGTVEHIREEAAHRSLYQRREADPHTFGIPRLRGEPKAALVAIQADEYGEGRLHDMHAELFGQTLKGLGLDDTPSAWIDHLPAETLATVNLVETFARSRRWRGALVGHLALFEMASVPVMSALASTYRRLGFNSWTTLFFNVHVVADAEHQGLAAHGLVAPLVAQDPALEADVRFGARCLAFLEGRLTRRLLSAWAEGQPSLRRALPEVTEPLPGQQDVPVGTDPRGRVLLEVPSPA